MAVRTSHEFNCLVLRDSISYLTLTHTPPSSSALVLHDRVGTGGSNMSGGTFSRNRWRKMRDEEERKQQAALAKRERELKRKAEAEHKAKAKAEAERKARWAAQQAALEARGQALHELFGIQAAQAAYNTSGVLERARMQAISAHSAQRQGQAHAAAKRADEAAVQRLLHEDQERVRQLLTQFGLGSLLRK